MYPFPSKLLKKWNYRYRGILDWLIKVGFLHPGNQTYVPNARICRYYYVNFRWNEGQGREPR